MLERTFLMKSNMWNRLAIKSIHLLETVEPHLCLAMRSLSPGDLQVKQEVMEVEGMEKIMEEAPDDSKVDDLEEIMEGAQELMIVKNMPQWPTNMKEVPEDRKAVDMQEIMQGAQELMEVEMQVVATLIQQVHEVQKVAGMMKAVAQTMRIRRN